MATPSSHRRRRIARNPWLVVALVAAVIVGLQLWSTAQTTDNANRIIRQTLSSGLGTEKQRQEIIQLELQNERTGLFWNGVGSSIAPLVTAIVALVGIWLGLRNYLDARSKDRLDRASTELNEILKNVASEQPRERAVGVVGLQHFLTADKEDYHLRVLAELANVARSETLGSPESANVVRNVRLATEQAARSLPSTVLQQVSWQAAELKNVDLNGLDLSGIDLRDAILEDADFRGCNLTGARFDNARLKGAKLDGADLTAAALEYADLAGASLVEAKLARASLRNALVWRMNVSKADLTGAKFDVETMPWELVANWRDATFDAELRDRLIERYGPAPSGPRVLMLMWEIPPLVAGGTWTACYHLVRRLRALGANITIAVPWDESVILASPFGTEVSVISLGMIPPHSVTSVYGAPAGQPDQWSPYARSSVPAASSPYGWASPYATSWPAPASPYGYGFAGSYGGSGRAPGSPVDLAAALSASLILRLTSEFRQRVASRDDLAGFDIVHAHDWVTFAAAEALAEQSGASFVAHFHSTVADRQPGESDYFVSEIEQQAVVKADRLAVPSRGTAERLQALYGAPPDRIAVAPNVLSKEVIPLLETGRFETKRVVFTGRLTRQKGPDRFLELARRLKGREASASFRVYGDGEELAGIAAQAGGTLELMGPLEWKKRGSAFAGAAVVVVPSRAEPFGMVVAEAMQHRVPVVYPADSGIAEVIDAGIKVDPGNIDELAAAAQRLLEDFTHWENTVEAQTHALRAYADEERERTVEAVWAELAAAREPQPARG